MSCGLVQTFGRHTTNRGLCVLESTVVRLNPITANAPQHCPESKSCGNSIDAPETFARVIGRQAESISSVLWACAVGMPRKAEAHSAAKVMQAFLMPAMLSQLLRIIRWCHFPALSFQRPRQQQRPLRSECTGTSVTSWTGDIRYKYLARLGRRFAAFVLVLALVVKTLARRRGRWNVAIPKGFPKSVGRVGSRALWLSMLSTLCHFHGLLVLRRLGQDVCWYEP